MIYVSICLSIYLSIYLSISVYLSIYVSILIYLSVYLSIYQSKYIYLSIYLSIYLCLSVYLCIYLPIHSFICLFGYSLMHSYIYSFLSIYFIIYYYIGAMVPTGTMVLQESKRSCNWWKQHVPQQKNDDLRHSSAISLFKAPSEWPSGQEIRLDCGRRRFNHCRVIPEVERMIL